jgi:NAD+ kinase
VNDSPHILVAHKKSLYQTRVIDEHDASLAKLIEQRDVSVERVKQSHEAHQRSLEEVCEHLSSRGLDFDRRFRGDIVDTKDYDLVITVGGDGTVLDMSHKITDVPMLAVNSDPQSSIGYFCAGTAEELPMMLKKTLDSEWDPLELGRFSVRVNDEVSSVPALNDVLISHENPAAVSHYLLRIGDNEPEEQKSSGIWVSTPAGSTAAIRSAGGYVLPLDSERLQFLVREPYPVPDKSYRFLKGIRPIGETIEVISQMHDGRIFVDGPHIHYPFTIGDRVRIDGSAPPLRIYGISERRRTG